MKCQDLLRAIGEYVDGEISPSICADLERHLAGCNPCKVVVDNVRKTITLYRAGRPYPLPAALRRRLHEAIAAQWRKEFPPETGTRRRRPLAAEPRTGKKRPRRSAS